MGKSISAVILAGGEAKRFNGIPKTEILIGGRRIIDRMLNVLGDLFDEIIIVSNTAEQYSVLEKCKSVADIYAGFGPLGGIHAAMKKSSKEAVFVFGGDMPFLDKNLIISQMGMFMESEDPALVPLLNELEQPLHAIYLNSLSDEIEKVLNSPGKHSIKYFLDRVNPVYMKLPETRNMEKALLNINTPAEAEQAENLLK